MSPNSLVLDILLGLAEYIQWKDMGLVQLYSHHNHENMVHTNFTTYSTNKRLNVLLFLYI